MADSKTLSVRILAKDDASKVFKAIGDSASKAADELEKAGNEGANAFSDLEAEARQVADSMRKAGDAAEDTSDQIERVGESANRAGVDVEKMGAALLTIGAGLAYAGNLAMEHERLVVGLQKAYGDAANDMIGFADTLSSEVDNLFNNDEILAGERYFATLYNQYELSVSQIQDLMRTTADLAAAAGIGFEDASNRVTAAIRGETEGIELLGATLNQMAIDREGLTLSMTNQEAAQFRLNALNEQIAWSTGTAAAIAQTSAGDWARLTNQMKDAAQGAGEFIGPYGSMIAGFGTGAVGLAQFAGGFGALSTGIKSATVASRAFIASPLGITVTALAATIGIASAAFLQHKQAAAEAKAEWEAAELSVVSLSDAINQMALTGDTIGSRAARGLAEDIFGNQLTGADGWIDWYASELQKIRDYRADQPSWLDELVREDMIADGLDPSRINDFGVARQRLIDELMPTGEDEKRLADAFMDLLSLRNNPNIDQAALDQQMADLFASRNEAEGRGIDWLAGEYEKLYAQQISVLEGTEAVALATWDYIDSVNGATNATGDLSAMLPILTGHYARLAGEMLGQGGIAAATDDMDNFGLSTMTAAHNMGLLALEYGKVAAAFHNMGRESGEALIAMAESAIDPTLDRIEELQEMIDGLLGASTGAAQAGIDTLSEQVERVMALATSVTGMDNPLTAFNATSMASSASELAGAFASANANASDLYRVLVGNTDQIKSQADATLSWAEELINVRGELGRIDDLVNKGLLTGTSGVFDDGSQYAAAQDAYDSIAISTERINDNLDAIQAIQSPMIAAMQEQQAAYTEELLKQPAAVQLTALAWMDAATASRAFEIQALAASAATGELGTNGVAAMTSYIDSIVQAEPATAALLEELGLIQNVVRDSSGMILSYEVDLSGSEGAQSEISLLTESIDRLTAAILGIPVAELYADDQATPVIDEVISAFDNYEGKKATGYVLGNNSDAMGVIDESSSALGALDGDSATVYIYAQDLASGLLGGVSAMINGLDGRTATTYVRTVSMQETQALGGIPGAAVGGIPVELAEWGPERLHYANGGTAMAYDRGIYNVPPMTYVSPNHATGPSARGGGTYHFHIAGSIIPERELIGKAAAAVWQTEAEEAMRDRLETGVF